jgi:hypothetical protein
MEILYVCVCEQEREKKGVERGRGIREIRGRKERQREGR